jgi:hypothetical protein
MVSPSGIPAMTVVVKSGLGFQDVAAGTLVDGSAAILSSVGTVLGLDDLDRYKPLPLLSDFTFTVPAAPAAGNSRIDIIEVTASRVLTNPLSRDVLNTGTGIFSPSTVDKTLEFALDSHTGSVVAPTNSTAGLSYKQGTVFATTSYNPANVPATSPGYIKIAEIFVPAATVSITGSLISDFRPLLFPGNVNRASALFTYTASTGVIALSRVVAPPGVFIGFKNTPVINTLSFFVVLIAGDLLGAASVNTYDPPTGNLVHNAFVTTGAGPGVSNALNFTHIVSGPNTINSTFQSALAGQGINVGIGQPCAIIGVNAVTGSAFFTDGTANVIVGYEATWGY